MAYRETTKDGLSGPIRSIRIAMTLVERFRTLIATPLGDDSSLMTAEVQRLYPEIWNHLDEAARALRRLGRDVSRFQAIRAQELGALGITDVESSLDIHFTAMGRLRVQQTKSVTFNLGGYNRANFACEALMAAIPEVDWAELARAEDREIAAAGSMRGLTWKRGARFAAIAAVVVAASVVLYVVLTTAKVDDRPPPRPPDKQAIVQAAERGALLQREKKIEEMKQRYARTCDASLRAPLASLLRENGQATTAQAIETEKCVPVRIRCNDDARRAISDHVGKTGATTAEITCRGITIAGANGTFVPAYFVLAGAYRGVFTEDAQTELVPLAETPATRYIGAGDFDGDGTDEIVTIGTTLFVVSRIAGGTFVDVPGPSIVDGCSADVAVVNRDGTSRIAMTGLTVGKRCVAPGEHDYKLVGNQLVEEP